MDITKFRDLINDIKKNLTDDFFVAVMDLTKNLDDVKQPNILFLSIDNWGDDEFLLTPETMRTPSTVDQIKNFIAKYPDKNFYITTTCPFVQEYFTDCDNVKIIYWGDDFLMHPDTKYQRLNPISEKRFNKPWHWTCLNNNIRTHRNICIMFLLGSDIKNGYIKFDPIQLNRHASWQSFLQYLKINKYQYLHTVASTAYPVLEQGFIKIKNNQGYQSKTYLSRDNKNAEVKIDLNKNFDKGLKPIFSHSIVDIINETVFINRSGIITEKYLNTVYGYNFPIYIGMAGSITHLKSLGFDLFDDIIDHSYDNIQDHYTRMITAIRSNQRILEDREFALESWHKCQSRFYNNWLVIEKMYADRHEIAKNKVLEGLEKNI
jgi:hypothetical protein